MKEISLTEAAKKLGKSRQAVHEMYKGGKFPNARMEVLGALKLIRIPLSDIEALKQKPAKEVS